MSTQPVSSSPSANSVATGSSLSSLGTGSALQITGLASFPNVFCKVSGMVTEADPERWTIEDLQPFVEHVLQAFGEDRVAFGSDWPVVLEASSYRRWVEALDALTGRLSPEAKRKLWAGNARRFYRIG